MQHEGLNLHYVSDTMLCKDQDKDLINRLKKEAIKEQVARSSGSVFYQLAPANGNVRLCLPQVRHLAPAPWMTPFCRMLTLQCRILRLQSLSCLRYAAYIITCSHRSLLQEQPSAAAVAALVQHSATFSTACI